MNTQNIQSVTISFLEGRPHPPQTFSNIEEADGFVLHRAKADNRDLDKCSVKVKTKTNQEFTFRIEVSASNALERPLATLLSRYVSYYAGAGLSFTEAMERANGIAYCHPNSNTGEDFLNSFVKLAKSLDLKHCEAQ